MAGKVIVGCKLPHGIRAELDGQVVEFKGTNSSNIIGGHGITENVDKDFWDAWLAKNQGLAFVRNGFLFAETKAASTKAKAKEQEAEKTGFEPVDPEELPKGLEQLDGK
ncbi:MAG: hypothetical protein EOO69_04530 [Moraxellaceae bacterium]|nr:MAG: hypothetical protein EOO69_04530 [Moraxellaceae bacterium]